MSRPLKLDSDQLRHLGAALDELTDITRKRGVSFTSYGTLTAEIGDSALSIYHDGERYVVDDRNGD